MAVNGNEPVSTANLKAVTESIVDKMTQADSALEAKVPIFEVFSGSTLSRPASEYELLFVTVYTGSLNASQRTAVTVVLLPKAGITYFYGYTGSTQIRVSAGGTKVSQTGGHSISRVIGVRF